MTVYRIRSPQAALKGYFGAVDFCGGMGSTSSLSDAVKLLELEQGFKLVGLTDKERAEVLAFRAARRKAHADWLADFQKQDAYERTPEYTAKALERMEEQRRNDPKWKAERLLEKQLRRHSGVRTKKNK